MKEFKHNCEFFVLQCMPDPLKGERVNVGMVLRDGNPQDPSVRVRIAESFRRIRCLEPGFDVDRFEEILRRAESVFANNLEFERQIELFEEWPEELVLLPKKAVLTDSIDDEIELLANQYLRARDWKVVASEEDSRATILREMRDTFEKAGVWRLMDKRLPAAEFTRRGDTLKLDCGYIDRSNSVYRVFHAVPLIKDCNIAKALAYSWPMIRDGIAAKRQLGCEMRVVVSDDLDLNQDSVAFGWETMKRAGLHIEPLARMPEFAKEARVALNA
jgi:Protein of unknown function (DUF3037)